MPKLKYKDLTTGSMVQDLIDANYPINSIPPRTGLYNTRLGRPGFSYNKPAGARQMKNQGAYIVFGQVPPGGHFSGYGKMGVPADAIDLVVGRGSSMRDGLGPENKSVIDNNFATDAARIYICRLTNIDEVFNIVSSPGSNEGRGLVARSGIGIKADGVRIIGREGVKIITGKMPDARGFGGSGETNSVGGKIPMVAPKIELIAGNAWYRGRGLGRPGSVPAVQGVSLGHRTRDSLMEMSTIIGEIWSALFSLTLTQAGFNSVLGVTPVPWHASASPVVTQQQYSRVINSLYHTKQRAEWLTWNCFRAGGSEYIVSRNVLTN